MDYPAHDPIIQALAVFVRYRHILLITSISISIMPLALAALDKLVKLAKSIPGFLTSEPVGTWAEIAPQYLTE